MRVQVPQFRADQRLGRLDRAAAFGVVWDRLRAYLVVNAPGLVERFDATAARARADDQAEG